MKKKKINKNLNTIENISQENQNILDNALLYQTKDYDIDENDAQYGRNHDEREFVNETRHKKS